MSMLKWSLSEAAQQCQVSRSTIRRYREQGKFPNAVKEGNTWMVPVTDLIAADLNPGQPSPPDEQPSNPAQGSSDGQLKHAQELAELRAQLSVEQAHRQAAEQVAAERERAVDDMRRAMRMIEQAPPPPEPPAQQQETAAPNRSAPQPQRPQGPIARWFGRR